MSLHTSPDEPAARPLMRSGIAARLAGLSPSTLRIWENRYGVVAPPKAASGQRTYSMKDIERLRLIKQLTVDGHAIGSVARLDTDALLALSSGNPIATARVPRVLVIGQSAAHKLEGRLKPAPASVFSDLAHAEREIVHAGSADVLVIHVASLHASMTDRITSLRGNLPVARVILVYSFGAQGVAETLAAAGVTVRREPVSGRELAGMVMASRPPDGKAAIAAPSNPRRYSDADLVTLREMPSMVACECPRHLAEIVTLLVGFEEYSTECATRNAADVALHRHLHEVTSAARSMLEQALARLVAEEGLVL
ncbi:MerR family transcriptional regulator [Roseateles amylovorans]|uniref:MerR family transcriptional regulator n=1 Tax=Roseateles amylovorans TaxID=2978473 RepID=A0ABY6B1W2_9BURK|nr:MerR family transcriptional regulator [Roseateles amylovorans]UXH79060.1 MerR family transcriptional regulator [Roseateles amylovorans]